MMLLFGMFEKRIVLQLTAGHCVECTARAMNRELVEKMLLRDIGSSDTEAAKLELLQRFILETDFQKLRAENPLLDGRSGVKVIVEESLLGRLKIKTVKQGDFTVIES